VPFKNPKEKKKKTTEMTMQKNAVSTSPKEITPPKTSELVIDSSVTHTDQTTIQETLKASEVEVDPSFTPTASKYEEFLMANKDLFVCSGIQIKPEEAAEFAKDYINNVKNGTCPLKILPENNDKDCGDETPEGRYIAILFSNWKILSNKLFK